MHTRLLMCVGSAAMAFRLAAQDQPVLRDCEVRGLTGSVQCGTVLVPEDRAHPEGRQLAIAVAIARATGPDVAPDPFVLLAGGPGQASTEMGPFATEAFSRVRIRRDLVFIDARGTGRSRALKCDLMRTSADLAGETLYPSASVAACRDSLGAVADLRQYTTANIADDLEAVRRAFKWPSLNLYGTSYGTRVAFVYLHRHPTSVRSAVLKAVMPPGIVYPLHYAEDADAAFRKLERDCIAEAACRRAYPSLRGDLAVTLERAEQGQLRAAVKNAQTGVIDTVPISRSAIASTILSALQSARDRSRIPHMLHRSALGDASMLAAAVITSRQALNVAISSGMHLSSFCSDDGNRLIAMSLPSAAKHRLLGSSRVEMAMAACRQWPTSPAEAGAFELPKGTAPLLLVSGEIDPNTPPERVTPLLARMPNARHIVLRGVSHGWSNVEGCGSGFVADFVARASVKGLDVRCARTSSAPAFVTDP